MLRRLGTPAWALLAFGMVTIPAGLRLWSGLGRDFGIGPNAPAPGPRTALVVTTLAAATIGLELLLSEPL